MTIRVSMLVLASLISTACVSAEPADTRELALTSTEPAKLFREKCGMCHQENGMGTGLLSRRLEGDQALLEKRDNLTASLISTAVRSGLGNMQPMSRAEVSDEQLGLISRYLTGGGQE